MAWGGQQYKNYICDYYINIFIDELTPLVDFVYDLKRPTHTILNIRLILFSSRVTNSDSKFIIV